MTSLSSKSTLKLTGGISGIGQLKSGVSYEFESSWPVSVYHRGVTLDEGIVTIMTNEPALKEVRANKTLKEGVSRGVWPFVAVYRNLHSPQSSEPWARHKELRRL